MTNADQLLLEFTDNCTNLPLESFTPDATVVLETLEYFHIPENSLLGALAASGGFSLAYGKLRIFGSPTLDQRSIISVNNVCGHDPLRSYLIVAEDIYGNYYAINVAYSNTFQPGEVIAFFADGIDWESTSDSLTDFLSYCFQGDLQPTFSDFATGNVSLEEEAATSRDRVISFYPPLFSEEGSSHGSSKKLVKASEELSLRLALRNL